MLGTVLETDLYPPVYEYFTQHGYCVRSEVMHCDLTAVKEDEVIAVELKRSFTLSLLAQAVARQRFADAVYVVVPRPREGLRSRKWRDMCHLLRRLELGLLLVTLRPAKSSVDLVFHPSPYEPKHNSQRRSCVIREVAGRSCDCNTGGSTRKKLMTAYRENAVHIACCLEQYGIMSPKQLRQLGTGDKTQAILRQNFYGWFERTERGLYALHETGRAALMEYSELAGHYRQERQGQL